MALSDHRATVRARAAHRATLFVCVAASTEDEMSAKWDALTAALDAVPGVFFQGGASEPMSFDDVIAGSPLAEHLEREDRNRGSAS